MLSISFLQVSIAPAGAFLFLKPKYSIFTLQK